HITPPSLHDALPICRESHTEQIDKVKLAAGMLQAKDINRFPLARENGFSSVLRAVAGEIAKKRGSRAQRQETYNWLAGGLGFREDRKSTRLNSSHVA